LRRNVRLNMDQGISDQLDVSVGLFYNESHNRDVGQTPFFNIYFMPPDVDLAGSVNTNGEPYQVNIGPTGLAPSGQTVNPLYAMSHTHNETDRTRVQGSFRTRWRPTSWLSFEGSFGYDRSQSSNRNYTSKGTLSFSNSASTGSLSTDDIFDRAYNGQVSASLTKAFGRLESRLKLAGALEDETYNEDYQSGSSFASLAVPELTNVTSPNKTVYTHQEIQRARNVFAVGGLTYKNRYIFDALIRRDGSSLFGSGARYHTYYRISGAYRLGEDFKLPGVQELKLRASVGTAGLRPPYAAQYETFTSGSGGIAPATLGNKALKPAQSKETEFGIDAAFLDRFNIELTQAKKVTSGQVLPVPLSSVAGFTNQWRNAGTLEGTTYEAALGVVLANSRSLSWNLNVTFDRTRMKVTELNTIPFAVGNGTAQSNQIFLIAPGVTYGAMYGYRWDRTRQDLADNPANWSGGKYGSGTLLVDTTTYSANEDGLLIKSANHGTTSEAPIKYTTRTGSQSYQIGDANPNFSMSFSTNFTWHGFSVFGLLDWVNGGDIYNLPRQWMERSEFRSGEMDQAPKKGKTTAWCTAHPNVGVQPCSGEKATNYFVTINDANGFNSWFVESGAYARLRELSVAYSLSPTQLRAIGLSRLVRNLRVSVNGRNLITWTKYSGLDPDTHNTIGGGGDPTTFRFDNFNYPNFRTFSGMVEIGF
jgi:hypothetical protein